MLKSVQKIVFRLIYNDKHRMGIDVCNITGSVVASVVFILFRHIARKGSVESASQEINE